MTKHLQTDEGYGRYNKIDMTLHVCRTGAKEQFYTLYQEGVCWSKYGATYYCNFIQNLAHNKADAEAKAEAYADKRNLREICHHLDIEVHDTPRPIYLRHEAFGVEMKMNKKRTVWFGNIGSEFWDEWKANKAEIKAAGYWVMKGDGGSWLLFKRIEQDERQYADEEE
jgi:hypothetical protein